MNMKRFISVGALSLGLAAGLQAQDAQKFSVSANLVQSLDGLKKITNRGGIPAGLTVDFSYTGMLANSGVPFRTSLGVNFLPGRENVYQEKISLTGIQLAGDLLIKLGKSEKLNMITGISINTWSVSNKGFEPGFEPVLNNGKGLKFGGRLGLEYRINQNWSAQVMLQAIELGQDYRGFDGYGQEMKGFTGLNPCWIQYGARFHF